MTKKFCATHHLFYTSCHCPMCVSEQSEYLAKRFCQPVVDMQVKCNKKDNVITEESLELLKKKFNLYENCKLRK